METFLLSVITVLLGVILAGGTFVLRHLFGQLDIIRLGVNDHYDKVTEILRIYGERIAKTEDRTNRMPWDKGWDR